MGLFRKKTRFDIETIFNKILNYKDYDTEALNESEMDFLQTPSVENIHSIYCFLNECRPYYKSSFFQSISDVSRNVSGKEKQLKIKLFAQKLLSYCVQKIDMTPDKEETILENSTFLLVISNIADDLGMHRDFKEAVFRKNSEYSKEVLKPFFLKNKRNKIKEEINHV
jgi:hypothetical protein